MGHLGQMWEMKVIAGRRRPFDRLTLLCNRKYLRLYVPILDRFSTVLAVGCRALIPPRIPPLFHLTARM
jgi:hypothetical protein